MKIKNLKVEQDSATYYDIGRGQVIAIKRPKIESFQVKGEKTMYWVNVSMFGHKGQFTTNNEGKGLFHIRGDGHEMKIKSPEEYSLIDQENPEAFLQQECDNAWEERLKVLQTQVQD